MDKQISRLIEQIAELARLSPFPDINLTVPVEVTLENHGVESDNTKAIQWISLSADLQLPSLITDARCSFEFLNDDVDEIWHSDCLVADTGLLADEYGAVSRLIDFLRVGLGWRHQTPSLDKVILSKSTTTNASGFHTDHFPFGVTTHRSRGSAMRVIVNLGLEARVVCFLLPANEECLALGDEYCSDEYKRLGQSLEGAMLLIAVLPGYSYNAGIAGVRFDAHNVLHCGLPQAGSMAAVLTDWREHRPNKK